MSSRLAFIGVAVFVLSTTQSLFVNGFLFRLHGIRGCQLPPSMRPLSMKEEMVVDAGIADNVAVPGRPKVISTDMNKLSSVISIAVDSTATEQAFAMACRIFNHHVAEEKLTVPGYPPGVALPPYVLFDLFNRNQVVEACGLFLQKEIQVEIDKINLPLVGKGRILDFHADRFKPGQPHVFELVCDLWPTVEYLSPSKYRNLHIKIVKNENQAAEFEVAKLAVREKFRRITPLPSKNTTLQWGLGAIVDMEGYLMDKNGNKGQHLSGMQRGEDIKIVMQRGRHMEGLVEGLLGATKGEMRSVKVKFPPRAKGPGAALTGMEAIMDVTVKSICETELPEWDEDLANMFKKGLSLKALEQQLLRSVEANDDDLEEQRNDALSNALLKVIRIEQVPPHLVETQLIAKFEDWLRDQKEQGLDEEQLKVLGTNANFEEFKKIHRAEVEDAVRLGIVFRDIAAKEKIVVTDKDFDAQIELLTASLPPQGMINMDHARAEIESVLMRLRVCEFLANCANIEYLDEVEQSSEHIF